MSVWEGNKRKRQTSQNEAEREHYYKNNHRSEGIREANTRTKVIIFCKSRPLNWN